MADTNHDKLGMAKEWEEAPTAVEEKPVPPVEPQKFVREIDVGGRVQRFEAESYEALVDKFVEAQTHATRKLQELNQAQKKQLTPEPRSSDFEELKPVDFKADDMTSLQSRLEEFRQNENNRRRREAEFDAARNFLQRHQDEYTPTPENEQKILKFLQKENLPLSKRNLDYAFEELRGELAAAKSAEKAIGATPSPQPAPPEPKQVTPPPSFIRPSLGGRAEVSGEGGIDASEFARIAQLPPAEMKARIEQIFRSSRYGR